VLDAAGGYVRVPRAPRLSYEIVWDYIRENATPDER